MKLPNAENAVVDIEKLRDYCLNVNHEEENIRLDDSERSSA